MPYCPAVFAVGNLAGPRLLGRLFDTLGRRPMISGIYILSGVLLVITAILFESHSLSSTSIMVALTLVFSALITTGDITKAGLALILGAALMIVGGFAELLFGVKAEQKSLEAIAQPLTAAQADRSAAAPAAA